MNKILKLDWILLISVFLLLAIGLLSLYSLSLEGNEAGVSNFEKQIIFVVLGLVLMFFFSFYDYRTFNSHSTQLYFAVIALLILVISLGTTIRGTTGWLGAGFFHIQPVEVAKIVLVIFLASFLSKKKTQLSVIVRTVSSVVLIFVPIFLILRQPDFGSASIIIAVWVAMLLVSGLSKKNLALLFLIGFFFVSSGWFFLKDYQKERLVNFVQPYENPRGSGYNVIQSIIAVGSGKMLGKGLGHGSQSQLNFLPEKHTDFIFATITEEMGFLGASVTLILFGVLLFRIKEAARRARDNFGYLLSIGILLVIFFQVLVNIGMNVGVMPVTGVPLPFLSYGGSSLVTLLISIGIIQNVYMRRADLDDLKSYQEERY